MAAVIRLKRLGTKKTPHQRIIVIDEHKGRDMKALEELGYYDPTKKPAFGNLKKERILHWLKVGAKPSVAVANIFRKSGII
ncbi:MAG: 30S ribosomal protein S16 [Candidatus Omnitrophota bacterium]|jgi:small subunit ribosomal protein S16